jgi:hypothetical protein
MECDGGGSSGLLVNVVERRLWRRLIVEEGPNSVRIQYR